MSDPIIMSEQEKQAAFVFNEYVVDELERQVEDFRAHLMLKAEDIAKYEGRYAMGWDVLRQQRFERVHAAFDGEAIVGGAGAAGCGGPREGAERRPCRSVLNREPERMAVGVGTSLLDGLLRLDLRRTGRTWWDVYNTTVRDPIYLVGKGGVEHRQKSVTPSST